jgi:hypothetical protein
MDGFIDYTSDGYNSLPSYEVSQRSLQQHRNIIARLGEVITKYKLEDKIGVSLLHKHFDVPRDKKLVRTREANGVVAKIAENTNKLLPAQWRLMPFGSIIGYAPIEFIDAATFSPAAIQQTFELQWSSAFLREFAAVLKQYGVADTFGIATLNVFKELGVSHRNEVICERPGSAPETSEFDVLPKNVKLEPGTGQALWTFSALPTSGSGGAKVHCAYMCIGCRTVQ